MLKQDKPYWIIHRHENSPDTVRIEKQLFTIRFSATHAEHISANKADPAHQIDFLEIVHLLKVNSLAHLTTHPKAGCFGQAPEQNLRNIPLYATGTDRCRHLTCL